MKKLINWMSSLACLAAVVGVLFHHPLAENVVRFLIVINVLVAVGGFSAKHRIGVPKNEGLPVWWVDGKYFADCLMLAAAGWFWGAGVYFLAAMARLVNRTKPPEPTPEH